MFVPWSLHDPHVDGVRFSLRRRPNLRSLDCHELDDKTIAMNRVERIGPVELPAM